ncbi:MAG: hypothetical protein KGL39_14050 [Patescibacteria group bacterium]|nr:hypothetical protein [Patescibacteria group bacterium]
MKTPKIIQDTLQTQGKWDTAKLMWVSSAVGFLVLAGVSVIVHKNPFVAQDYGIGAGALLSGGGLGSFAHGMRKDQSAP